MALLQHQEKVGQLCRARYCYAIRAQQFDEFVLIAFSASFLRLKKNMKKINKSKVRRHVGTSHTHTPSRMQTYRGFTRTQAIHVTESHCIV